MAPDDLNAPLGQVKPKPPRRIGAPQVLAGLLAASGLVVVVWAAFVHDPLGGEPVAVVSRKTPAAEQRRAQRHDGAMSDADTSRAANATEELQPQISTAKTITIIDGSNGNRQEIVIPEKGARPEQHSYMAPVNPNLLELTKDGAIPRVGTDGALPSQLP